MAKFRNFLYKDMKCGMIFLSHSAQLPVRNKRKCSKHFMNQATFHSTFPILVITKIFDYFELNWWHPIIFLTLVCLYCYIKNLLDSWSYLKNIFSTKELQKYDSVTFQQNSTNGHSKLFIFIFKGYISPPPPRPC